MEPAASLAVDLDVPATMRDGTVLRANVYRPAGDGRWPVLLARLPYGKEYELGRSSLDPVNAARRGYAVIVQDTRGRFRSEGEFVPYAREAEDGFDSVQWAAGLPYSDGQVGMFGGSYFGQTQWLAAVEQPPALKALVPNITFNGAFNGHVFRNGALELGMVAAWTLAMGFDNWVRRSRSDPAGIGRAWYQLAHELDNLAAAGFAELPLEGFGPLSRTGMLLDWPDIVAHEMDREFSRTRMLTDRHERVLVPTFNAGGWFDCFLGDTLLNYRRMRDLGRPTKLLVGPWAHGRTLNPIGELSFGYAAQAALIDLRIDWHSLQLRWFDHWLKGLDTGILQEPPVKLFVMGRNRWRDEADWPLARARTVAYHLRQDGRLTEEPPGEGEDPDSYLYDPADPVPTRGGNVLISPEYPPGPYDQRPLEARPDVLVFTSDPLQRDTEVTGPLRVRLFAASDAPDTDWVARLCDVHPDGRSFNLADCILRARYRDFATGAAPSLIEPGRVYEYDLDLWATSNVFMAGHRIRLHVTSSSFPRWDRNPNTGHGFGRDAELRPARQTVFHDAARASALMLPIVEE